MISIGLISDTHLPDRWRKLPTTIFDIFANVDLILHAGDVGKLYVLDELSQIAPVVAVHGNDEEPETVDAMPYHQVVHAAGHRVFLSHCHYPDRQEELASRKIDSWHPKLRRRAAMGQDYGADIVVFGHSHIPMTFTVDDMLLINPGAIASGNHFTRQTLQTVALLHLDTEPIVEHYTLDRQRYHPTVDIDTGFNAANLGVVCELILDPRLELEAMYQILGDGRFTPAINALRPMLYPIWEGDKELLSAVDIVEALRGMPEFEQPMSNVPVLAQYL
jgi:putative phosphoesterase